jgi:hypothetical protein
MTQGCPTPSTTHQILQGIKTDPKSKLRSEKINGMVERMILKETLLMANDSIAEVDGTFSE